MKKVLKISLFIFLIIVALSARVNAAEADEIVDIEITGTLRYDYSYKVLELVNEERKAEGLNELKMDESLLETAMLRAAELSIYFDHVRPNGTFCFSANNLMALENIVAGQYSPEAAMDTWMNSSGHKDNILSKGTKGIGIGCFYIDGLYYWVQCFEYNTPIEPNGNIENIQKTMKIEVNTAYLNIQMQNVEKNVERGQKLEIKDLININAGWQYVGIYLNPKNLEWTSSNTNVAIVDKNGTVMGVNNGKASVTGTIGEKTITYDLTVTDTDKLLVSYTTHVQRQGWQSVACNGLTSGTDGQGLRLEGIKIKIENVEKNELTGGIESSTHVQNIGWQDWVKNNEMSGTSGKGLRLEAIKIKLTGDLAKKYDVYYRVHAEHYGWLDWAKNGGIAGTAGYGYRLEGIQIVLVEKGKSAPGGTSLPYAIAPVKISYTTHVQSEGWQDKVKNGAISGTVGKGLRLEAIKIGLDNVGINGLSGTVEYRTHVQREGWQDWVKNNELSGTSGKGLRLEAIQIRLTKTLAEKYDIYYRVHAQHYGWLGWAKNGEEAGTAGYGYRLEGIQIMLVKKGAAAPGSTANHFYKK